MTQVQPSSPRKVFLGIAAPSQMFQLFDRHRQSPYDEHRISGRLYAGEWFRIDRASHCYMENVLPPLFQRGDCFAMREFLTESVTSVFFELTIRGETRFYHAYCDLADKASVEVMRAAIIHHETSREPLSRETALEHVWSTTPNDARGYDPEDSRERHLVIPDGPTGTAVIPLEQLTTAEIARRVVGFGSDLRAAA